MATVNRYEEWIWAKMGIYGADIAWLSQKESGSSKLLRSKNITLYHRKYECFPKFIEMLIYKKYCKNFSDHISYFKCCMLCA